MIVGGYTLHLYCDRDPCGLSPLDSPGEFSGTTKRVAYREARDAGWKIGRNDTVTCPTCVLAIRRGQ